jgi:hypothetical protein
MIYGVLTGSQRALQLALNFRGKTNKKIFMKFIIKSVFRQISQSREKPKYKITAAASAFGEKFS